MTPTLSTSPAARPRWRAIIATFALVGALVASTSAMSATADVVGSGPGAVSGTVTTGGQPIENAGVSVSVTLGEGTPFSAYTTTDANGHYEFTGLELGPYDVSTYVSGYQQQAWQSTTLTEATPAATIDFVLVPYEVGTGTISGYVTADGVPLANLSVSAFSNPSGQNVYSITDENGFYQLTDLANGFWQVSTWAGPEYQSVFPGVVELSDAAPNATVDFPFLSWPVGTASISGIVTDAATGAPLADVSVSVYSQDAPHQSNQTTDAAGAFSLELLPEGTYYLNFWAFGYLHASAELVVAEGESVIADRALYPANATISGHIKAKNGAPLAGVYVDAHSADGNIGSGVTDENGDYVITEVGAVAYTLNVGGIGTPYQAKERVVTPLANGNVSANFTLKDRKTGTLGGFVAEPGGEWYPDPVCVTLYSSKNKHVVAETVTWGENFGDGSYAFIDLKPGSYTVEFEDCDDDPFKKFDNVFLGGAAKYKDATFVTVAAAQDSWDNSHTLTYRAPNSTIAGHIAKPNGTPIAGLTVHASGEDSSVDAITDANGDYTIAGLYSGEYTVSAGGAGTLYVHKEKSVTVDEGGSATANFTLGKK